MKYIIDRKRLLTFSADVDLDLIKDYLDGWNLVCEGAPKGGKIGELEIHVRFRWLTAARSTIIQSSEVHSGLCFDLDSTLDELFTKYVLWPASEEYNYKTILTSTRKSWSPMNTFKIEKIASTLAILISLILLFLASCSPAPNFSENKPPNLVLILADDLGYGNLENDYRQRRETKIPLQHF